MNNYALPELTPPRVLEGRRNRSACKESPEPFRSDVFGSDRNYFDMELMRGNSIRQAQFEPGGIDEDDDYIVFDRANLRRLHVRRQDG
jgi:hypothetical protein